MLKYWKAILLVLVILATGLAYYVYNIIYGPNISDTLTETSLNLPQGTDFDTLTKILVDKDIIIDEFNFRMVSKLMKFNTRKNISGRFEIVPGWSNRELISLLRANKQVTINVTINSVRLISDMAGKVSQYIEPDSLKLLNYLTDEDNLLEWGYTTETILSLFIPNTYQFYWDTSPEKFVKRMQTEHDKYWNTKNRKENLAKHGLTPAESYTLASIIEKETTNPKETKTISGVYHNRLRQGIALQADPTVVFGLGDFTIRRVLNKHLEHPSPYNTYLHLGLPPGPIYMPTLSSLDAAIFPEDHKYIFFCAKPGYDNEHSFAKTLSQHNRNARMYHSWLNKEGIKY
ncbi:endolytic transglycosylase MltG [Saprospiraceae bacterium]|nr:endolytic transglycosylase MltG [Saprospiraceae bacterium]